CFSFALAPKCRCAYCRNRDALAVNTYQARLEARVRLAIGVQQRVEGPVFNRIESANLSFALDNESQRHGLHAARRKAAAHFMPEQRRNLVADKTVQHAAGLLRVDK